MKFKGVTVCNVSRVVIHEPRHRPFSLGNLCGGMPGNSRPRVAVSCSSNMNRSMEAHAFLSKKGFNVRSFGTGDKVKLPGPAPDKPNCYEFGITYEEIYQDLFVKDRSLYTQNGLLHMLDRNRRIKAHPERFQSCKETFDIIVTCEERVYDQVLEFFENHVPEDNTPVHVVNIDIQDNNEEATIGAFLICDLVSKVVYCFVAWVYHNVHWVILVSFLLDIT